MGGALADADVDQRGLTGSETVGRKLAAHLGAGSSVRRWSCRAVTPCSCWTTPTYTWREGGVVGATVNRGQTCIAARRAFVQRSRYEAFLDALRPLVEQTAPMRLALAGQARQADRVVEAALAEKAGSSRANRRRRDEQTSAFRVVADARPEWAVCQEASFAPLLAVLPFESDRDALELQQHCPFGLAASIFTVTCAAPRKWRPGWKSALVTINDAIAPTAHPATPFGGRGASGWGATQEPKGCWK